VASQELHLPRNENAMTVFYPMDKHVREEGLQRWWILYRKNDIFIKQTARAISWFTKLPLPSFSASQWRNVMIDVVPDGPLAEDFTQGKKKLIPIIISHGLTASRFFFSVMARELASNGYLVIVVDHHDGSCIYTEKKDGKPVWFDSSTPFCDYVSMNEKVKTRRDEGKMVIDFISEPKFLQEVL
jgi:hypothetical protein